jgi:NTE family protein
MLGPVLDVFRLRQYFNVITRTREWVAGLRDDAGFLTDAARAVVRLPSGAAGGRDLHPFPPTAPYATRVRDGQRVALAATGGSGAMGSVVGVARALEEAGLRPAVISLCSGSAMFG